MKKEPVLNDKVDLCHDFLNHLTLLSQISSAAAMLNTMTDPASLTDLKDRITFVLQQIAPVTLVAFRNEINNRLEHCIVTHWTL